MNARRPIQLLALALTLVAAALFSVQSQASSGGWVTERYYARETSHSFADIGKQEGGGPADVYVSQQALADAKGNRIGIVNGYGVNLVAPYVFFQYTAFVGSSSVTLAGAVSLKEATQTYAIVGGTGRFAGMRGSATTSDAGSKGSLVVLRYRT